MKIQELLFKPLIIGDEENGGMILIFSMEERNITKLGPNFKLESELVSVIHLLDITRTIVDGEPVYAEVPITDEAKFLDNVRVLDEEGDYDQEIGMVANIIAEYIIDISSRLETLTKITNTIGYINNNSEPLGSTGNINLTYDFDNIVEIAFKSLDGSQINLKEDVLHKMGEVIRNVVMKNLETDLSDVNKTDRLKAEVEFKLIECLPNNMSANNVHINTDLIVEEIKKLKEDMNKEGFDPNSLDEEEE